jgi:hypothetical protein
LSSIVSLFEAAVRVVDFGASDYQTHATTSLDAVEKNKIPMHLFACFLRIEIMVKLADG